MTQLEKDNKELTLKVQVKSLKIEEFEESTQSIRQLYDDQKNDIQKEKNTSTELKQKLKSANIFVEQLESNLLKLQTSLDDSGIEKKNLIEKLNLLASKVEDSEHFKEAQQLIAQENLKTLQQQLNNVENQLKSTENIKCDLQRELVSVRQKYEIEVLNLQKEKELNTNKFTEKDIAKINQQKENQINTLQEQEKLFILQVQTLEKKWNCTENRMVERYGKHSKTNDTRTRKNI